MANKPMKIAYVITQRGDKSFWNRIGVAFINNDGSINVKLEAFPVNGELQLRDQVDRDDEERSSDRRNDGNNRGGRR